MGRLFGVLFLLIVLAASLGFLALGAFPPEPQTTPVHKLMPNDRFSRGS